MHNIVYIFEVIEQHDMETILRQLSDSNTRIIP